MCEKFEFGLEGVKQEALETMASSSDDDGASIHSFSTVLDCSFLSNSGLEDSLIVETEQPAVPEELRLIRQKIQQSYQRIAELEEQMHLTDTAQLLQSLEHALTN